MRVTCLTPKLGGSSSGVCPGLAKANLICGVLMLPMSCRYLPNYATRRCSILKTRLHFPQATLHVFYQWTYFVALFFPQAVHAQDRPTIYPMEPKQNCVVGSKIEPKNRWIYLLQKQLALSLSQPQVI